MRLSRRSFLASSVVAFLALIGPRLSRAKASKQRRVVVIGAGIAGLYAADLSRRKGFSVTVLEASSRVGGKTVGTELDGRFFDLGGQAFNKDMKRVAKLGRRFGLKALARPSQAPFFCDGDTVLTGAEFKPYEEAAGVLNKKAEALFEKSRDPKERPALAKMSVMTWAKGILPEKMWPYFTSYFETEWCDSPEDVSLLHYLDYSRDFPSEESDEMATRFDQGMAGLSNALAAELGSAVNLDSPVEKIVREKERIRVLSKGREFIADDVILAIPMPQLAKIDLSGEGMEALSAAAKTYKGAAVRKIILHYDKPFWKDRAREGVFSSPSGLGMMDNSDLSAKVYSLVVFVGGPAVRGGVDRAKCLEKIALVLGEDAKKPTGVIEQDWIDTEFLPGGYCSNRPPGEGASLIVPKSVGRIYVAGSEVAPEFPSYIEGALASADQAVRLMTAGASKRDGD